MGKLRVRRVLMALSLSLATLAWSSAPALGCVWASQTWPPNNSVPEQFQFGQYSQGGNYYYGVAGNVNTTYPLDPVDGGSWDVSQHVASLLGSADERGGAWLYTGWTVGIIGATHVLSATIFSEYQSAGQSAVYSTAGGAGSWTNLMTKLGGDLGGGNWRYDSYIWNGFAWELQSGNYATLTTSTTVQDAFGEVTDKQANFGRTQGACNLESQPNNSSNAYASLQLFVDNSTWQNWEPANGRYASAVNVSPYSETSTRNYTDLAVGGPVP